MKELYKGYTVFLSGTYQKKKLKEQLYLTSFSLRYKNLLLFFNGCPPFPLQLLFSSLEMRLESQLIEIIQKGYYPKGT